MKNITRNYLLMGIGICILAALIGIWSIKDLRYQPAKNIKSDEPGLTKQTLTFDTTSREYYVFQPVNVKMDQKTKPLVIVLHGGGGNALGIMESTQFNKLAQKDNFVVIYPNGTPINKMQNMRTWNAMHCCSTAFEDKVDDVTFISTLIDTAIAQYNVDPNEVFVTGLSNGAMMSYRVGAELGSKIKAMAPVAGTIGGQVTENDPEITIPKPIKPVSVITFHGLQDVNVPYFGGLGTKPGNKRLDMSVDRSLRFWAEANDCNTNPTKSQGLSKDVTISTYDGCTNDTKTILYTIDNHAHAWPGDPVARTEKFGDEYYANQTISATEVMWDFFKSLQG